MLALLLVALALGLSNLAASVGIGMAGAGARTRLRVGIVFGLFETCMPLLGLLLGSSLAHSLGPATRWIGAALLILTGGYNVIQVARHHGEGDAAHSPAAGLTTGQLLVAGFALSLDNLAVGFALGTYHVNVLVAIAVIGVTSVALSLLGLELGDRLAAKTVGRGELVGGLVLIGVGIALAAGIL